MSIILEKPDLVAQMFAENFLETATGTEMKVINIYRQHIAGIVSHPYGYHKETHALINNFMMQSENQEVWVSLRRKAPYIFKVIDWELITEDSVARGNVSDSFLDCYWECLETFSDEQAAVYAYEETMNRFGAEFQKVINEFPNWCEFIAESFNLATSEDLR